MRPIHEKFVPADLRDIVIRLEEWAEEQRLLERSFEQCQVDLRRCLTERGEGWERLEGRDLNAIEMKFFCNSLMFQHGGMASPAVTAEFMLFFIPRGRDEPFGSYRFAVRLDGYKIGGFFIPFLTPSELPAL